MQVVPGSSVYGYYWALSYSWNQSGEAIHRGGEDYDRIDEGKHRITEYRKIPGHNMKDRHGYNHIITDTDFDPETASTKFVTFEGLIQQVCKDFYIDYIWYDQMCISQSNHEEKMREIKQMHLIYSNALCTVALVPELQLTVENGELGPANQKILPNTQWCKRMWTLQEAYHSKNILFLGRNVHCWSNINFIWNSYKEIVKAKQKPTNWVACTALYHARNRTSNKAHDRIFALANIFPELMDGITFSYEQPLHGLTSQFYRALALKDISILWFGAALDSDSEDGITVVRQEEPVSRLRKYIRTLTKSSRATEAIAALQSKASPSWTGANGAHITQFGLKTESFTATPNYTITGDCMRLTSSLITVHIKPIIMVEKPYGFGDPDKYYDEYYPFTKQTCKKYDAEDGTELYFTEDGLPMTQLLQERRFRIAYNGSTDLVFVTIPSKWHRFYTFVPFYHYGLKATHILPLVVDGETAINRLSKPTHYCGILSLTEQCSKCIILFEPAFQDTSQYKGYPVLKKYKDCYKSIGLFFLQKELNIDSLFQPKQTFDII